MLLQLKNPFRPQYNRISPYHQTLQRLLTYRIQHLTIPRDSFTKNKRKYHVQMAFSLTLLLHRSIADSGRYRTDSRPPGVIQYSYRVFHTRLIRLFRQR